MRQPHGGKRANRLEAQNHPDRVEVDAAGRWSEGRASYPGNPEALRHATGIVRCRDGVSGLSRSHSSRRTGRRRAEPVRSGKSHAFCERRTETPVRCRRSGPTGGAGSPKCCSGRPFNLQTTRGTEQSSLLRDDRNRRIRNRTYGGVGGRRAQARLLPDAGFFIRDRKRALADLRPPVCASFRSAACRRKKLIPMRRPAAGARPGPPRRPPPESSRAIAAG